MGQSLTLQCEVTTVRGIISEVDIVWSSGEVMFNMTENITPIEMDNSLVYTDSYTISPLRTDDENRAYWCEVVINSNSLVTNNASVTLDVTGKICSYMYNNKIIMCVSKY